MLRHRNRANVKDVELATAKFLSEQEYYLFHMDTFGMQPPMQATYKRHHNQRESTNVFPETERKHHTRRNTNDTDLTPIINNLTGRSNPVRKTDFDVLSDRLRYDSTRHGSILQSLNVASNNHGSNRDAKGKRQQNEKNLIPKDAAIAEDAVRSHGIVTVSAIPKNQQQHTARVRSDPPRYFENHFPSEQRQHQNLFKVKQLQPRKSLEKERRQMKASKTYQYDHWPKRDKYKVTTTSMAYCV